MSIQKSLVDTLDAFIQRRLAQVNVSIPGRVQSYNASQQSATVQPLIQEAYIKEDGTRGVRDLPIIQAVPVAFPGAGSYGFTFPLTKGDTVMLLFSQASIDKWRKQGGKVDPLDDSRHDLSDAIAIPGLRSFSEATDQVADAAVLYGPEVRLGSKDASELIALKSDVQRLSDAFDAHVHAQWGFPGGTVDSGALLTTSEPNVSISDAPGTVALKAPNVQGSAKVKAE